MKFGIFIFLFSSIFLFSCSRCRWVEQHCHDRYGDDIDCGYWDCDDDPVSYDDLKYPMMSIELNHKKWSRFDKDYYKCSVKIKNGGNAPAYGVSCLIKLKSLYAPWQPNVDKDISRNYGVIESFSSVTIEFDFSDRAIVGCCAHTINVEITFYGKKGNKEQMIESFEL